MFTSDGEEFVERDDLDATAQPYRAPVGQAGPAGRRSLIRAHGRGRFQRCHPGRSARLRGRSVPDRPMGSARHPRGRCDHQFEALFADVVARRPPLPMGAATREHSAVRVQSGYARAASARVLFSALVNPETYEDFSLQPLRAALKRRAVLLPGKWPPAPMGRRDRLPRLWFQATRWNHDPRASEWFTRATVTRRLLDAILAAAHWHAPSRATGLIPRMGR